MADTIVNQTGVHAAIIFEGEEIKMVVPDTIWVYPGQSVQWIVVPSNGAKVTFDIEDDPIDWISNPSKNARISGKVRREARGDYKYSVSDGKGNVVDPRLRVKG
jgi:plastocyanin